MELLSQISFPGITDLAVGSARKSCSCISSTDLLAFSAPRSYKYSLDQKQQSSVQSDEKATHLKQADYSVDYGGVADTLFVTPLEAPWLAYYVVSMELEIRSLAWDDGGHKLLVCDSSGQVFVWQMVDTLINKWMFSHFSRSLFGDNILLIRWRPSLPEVIIVSENQMNFSDKFSSTSNGSHVKYFEGRSIDFWLALTTSSMLAVGLVQQKMEMIVSRVNLENPERTRLACADFTRDPQGHVLVATSTGCLSHPIRIHELSMTVNSNSLLIQADACQVSVQQVATFYVTSSRSGEPQVSSLRFTPGPQPILFVTINTGSGSEVQQWHVSKAAIECHPFLCQPQSMLQTELNQPVEELRWSLQKKDSLNSQVSSCIPFPYLRNASTPFVLLSLADNSVMRVGAEGVVDETRLPLCPGERIISLALSTNAYIAAAISSLYRVYLLVQTEFNLKSLTAQIERCLLSGTLGQDLLISIPADRVGEVREKILSDIILQPRGVQQLLKSPLNKLKVCLAMLEEPLQSHCCDQLTSLQVELARNMIISSISNWDYDDSGESLEDVLISVVESDTVDGDISKCLSRLDPAQDFLPDEATTTTVQPVLQWLVDLVVHILSSLPYLSVQSTGSWLCQQKDAIQSLLIMLLITRHWYERLSKCRPILSCSLSFEPFSKLFKLLYKWYEFLGSAGPQPDLELIPDSLLDECYLLPTQMILASYERSYGWRNIPSRLSPSPQPAHFLFGHEVDWRRSLALPYGQYQSGLIKDVFSHKLIGSQLVEKMKRCTRCSACTLVTKPLADHKSRPTSSNPCICGGFWAHDV